MSLVNVFNYLQIKHQKNWKICQTAISKLPKTENRIENLLLVRFLLSFLFSQIVEKWLVLFGPYCIISAYAQAYELKFTR